MTKERWAKQTLCHFVLSQTAEAACFGNHILHLNTSETQSTLAFVKAVIIAQIHIIKQTTEILAAFGGGGGSCSPTSMPFSTKRVIPNKAELCTAPTVSEMFLTVQLPRHFRNPLQRPE